jgi:hypothetical protein
VGAFALGTPFIEQIILHGLVSYLSQEKLNKQIGITK